MSKLPTELMDVALHPVVAAAIGSIVALKAIPGTGYVEKAVNVGASFALAVYAGPALVEYMEVTSLKVAAAVIFAVGATGLVVRNGTTTTLYRDASAEASGTSVDCANSNSAIRIGTGYQSLSGHIDELRITKGVARYTSAGFSIPSSAFPNS